MNTITIDYKDLQLAGENLKVAVVGDKMILVIDIRDTIGLSSSGKMMGVASTAGFTALPGGLKGNVYVGKKAG